MAPKSALSAHLFCVILHHMRKLTDLDEFDRRLLTRVRRNNLEPARILAENVGLSVSAVLRRLRRLREEDIIVADIAVVNPALTGSALTVHIVVRMKEPGRRPRDMFARSLQNHPEVTGAWEVTGDDDFLLKVQMTSMAQYDAFVRRALDEEAGVLSFKSLITISTVVEDDLSTRPLLGD
ncbi:Lrp/AsnC family transcriptional regulator [Sphingobium mellinum]|uniref:Lrp/AsnC family transcriptional regulator n=1 Tax=Sphingobium mellinum TaxID=1387166 RepID=UPI0030EDEB84